MAVTPPLLQLPPELLLRASSYISTVDLGSLRLTCRQIESYLFRDFAREFFTARRFMIEHISLEALVGIANHKSLGPYLTEVIIGTDVLCPNARKPSSWSRVHLDRWVLINTGYALQLLVDAFYKLKNLSVVGLHDCKTKRSQRVGEHRTRSGYGWSLPGRVSRKARTLCKSLRCPRLHHEPPISIFPLVLHARGVARARPRSIVVHPREKLPGTCLSIMSGPLAQGIIPVVSTLQTLHLSLHNKQGLLSTHRAGNGYLDDLQLLLKNTPLLEQLRLDFGLDDSMMPEKFVSWLSLHQNPTVGIPGVAELRYLATLELDKLTASPQSLLNVVSDSLLLNVLPHISWFPYVTAGR